MKALRALLGLVRDGWIVIGLTLALALALELGFRVYGRVFDPDSSNSSAAAIPNPLWATGWYSDYLREYDASFAVRWKPYVYFRRFPFEGRYIRVGQDGLRITPQESQQKVPATRVFFFGGSTMWGSYQRDDHTIPAEVAKRATQSGRATEIAVTNFGESGYVFTQEMIALVLELQAGNVPSIAVFYDGINDVASTLQNGHAGIPQNESNRAAEFAMGRALHPPYWGTRAYIRSWIALAGATVGQFKIAQGIEALVRRPAPPFLPADSASVDLVRLYAGNARIIEALSRAYGFKAVYVWQPSLHATQKRLTPYETQLMESIRQDAYQRRLREVFLAVPPLLDSAMATIAPGRFIDASGLFAGDTLSVFVDQMGHTTEVAIPRIVDTIWSQIAGGS